ncbi:predicted protein [Sclerotinia sclerotiorum 1980 UF-70]|uniref:Uncharacterized protein n=1 Tax=Sclerotinia sclerotiorum (strain ATCC 18683 / 1980 / Ss-1) TaxID=665079 RepID=A7EDW4_SCLS1|nr:predicted protein [Sclerotinia sclerotiorum 1980 UF-70]EDO01030.1 predicted protein [Sclerotinia sclerotiorum 1980 UF-70]
MIKGSTILAAAYRVSVQVQSAVVLDMNTTTRCIAESPHTIGLSPTISQLLKSKRDYATKKTEVFATEKNERMNYWLGNDTETEAENSIPFTAFGKLANAAASLGCSGPLTCIKSLQDDFRIVGNQHCIASTRIASSNETRRRFELSPS